MPRDRQTVGACPQCGPGTVACTHNSFQNGAERIDSWEHRCSDCTHRETRAFRSGPDLPPPEADPHVCPFCRRHSP
jgi:hypothetical protein